MAWSNEVTLEFLALYEQESAIWDPKDPLHKNRNAVADAWQRLESSLSIDCPVRELKKKKESLMATFRPLLNKANASKKMANGIDEVYKPNWFAYEVMAKFLEGIYQPRTSLSKPELEDVAKVYNEQHHKDEIETVAFIDHRRSTENTTKSPPHVVTTKRKSNKTESTKNGKRDAHKMLKNVCENSDRDECSLYAELLAKKLRALDENTRDILMNEIDNLVFRAKMQKQNRVQSFPAAYNHRFGGFQSNAHPQLSYKQNCPNVFLSSPSQSQPSPANSPSSGYSNSYTQSSPAHSYYSQHPEPTANCNEPPTEVNEVEHKPDVAFLDIALVNYNK